VVRRRSIFKPEGPPDGNPQSCFVLGIAPLVNFFPPLIDFGPESPLRCSRNGGRISAVGRNGISVMADPTRASPGLTESLHVIRGTGLGRLSDPPTSNPVRRLTCRPDRVGPSLTRHFEPSPSHAGWRHGPAFSSLLAGLIPGSLSWRSDLRSGQQPHPSVHRLTEILDPCRPCSHASVGDWIRGVNATGRGRSSFLEPKNGKTATSACFKKPARSSAGTALGRPGPEKPALLVPRCKWPGLGRSPLRHREHLLSLRNKNQFWTSIPGSPRLRRRDITVRQYRLFRQRLHREPAFSMATGGRGLRMFETAIQRAV